jgi:hypothetical protein
METENKTIPQKQTEKIEKIDNSELNIRFPDMREKDALGSGKHGNVYMTYYKKNQVVVKQYSRDTVKIVNHPEKWIKNTIENVVNVSEYGIDNRKILVLTEYFKNRKLSEYIDDKKNIDFPLKNRVNIILDIINGIQNIQKAFPEKKIIDITTKNVFVTDSLGAKIKSPLMLDMCDKDNFASVGAFFHFSSPEEIEIENLETIDMKTYKWIIVYRIGCVLFHLITRKIPFSEVKTDYAIYQKIIKGDTPLCKPDVETNKEEFARLVALVSRCWILDGSKRPTLEDIQKELKDIQKELNEIAKKL